MVTPGEETPAKGHRQSSLDTAAELSSTQVDLPSQMSCSGADFKLLTCWAPVPVPTESKVGVVLPEGIRVPPEHGR